MTTLADATFAEIEKAAPWLASTCRGLIRQQPDALSAYLTTVCTSTKVQETKANVHCHFISHDGNDRPRVGALATAVAQRLIDYCIPRSEFDRARDFVVKKNSTVEIVKLERKAQELFTDLATTGEGGEMLLYILIESLLRIPQILCKMPLKTNRKLHYNGADGIHGTVDENTGTLALYWGEAKLHKDLNQAISECFDSVGKFLLQTGSPSSAQARDLHLLRDNLDLNDPKLEAAVKRYLDPDDPAFRKLQFRAACLVGFNHDAYPTLPNTKRESEVKLEIEQELDAWRKKVGTQVAKQKLSTFDIEVFCLPFPSVDEFRDAFRKELGLT